VPTTLVHKTCTFGDYEHIVSVKCNLGGTIHGKCTTNIRSYTFITYTDPMYDAVPETEKLQLVK